MRFSGFFQGTKKINTMPRYKDEPTAVRVYTVCDESKFVSFSLFITHW